ncbi:MAG: PD40 domain-containing protein [Bacteroidales bacterium]|nr:PD40 domain-containing protein [Bacteroidales bacterium]
MKHRYSKLFVLIILFGSLALSARGQYYITGQEPHSTQWMQIRTPKFQIVFPQGYDSIARLYISYLKISSPYTKSPYLNKVRPVTIVLHEQSVYSNAFVNPAPLHADFFDMPSQEIYPQRWAKQLSLHEYRHVVQMNMMRSGFGKLVYLLLGQQGSALQFSGLPLWFIEGDAVYNETIHSNSGRGRTPDFVYMLKAQVLDKKIYPYDKAQFGSYKNFVPDHYTLGYQLVLNGINHYGINLWKQTINNVAHRPYLIFPFTIKMHQTTGKGNAGYYKRTLRQLKSEWQKQDILFRPDPFHIIKTNNRLYSNYLFVNQTKYGLIFEKSGLDNIHQFVMIDKKGKENTLFTPGYDFNESLSANDSLLLWNEMTFDRRWSNRDYSDLYVFNYISGKKERLTYHQRLFAPALSPDGKTIVAVSVDEKQHYSLYFYDLTSHKLTHSFSTSNNLFFMTPRWSADGKKVVVTVLGDNGKSIFLINTLNWEHKQVLPFSFTEIKEPAVKNNWLLYTGTYEGKDNLYVINLKDNHSYRLFNARFGARNATFSDDGRKIYFSEYTANGFKPAYLNFDTKTLIPFNTNQRYFYPIDSLVHKKTFILDDTVLPMQNYPVRKYSRLKHLFNPYSWGPFSVNMSNYQISPGFSVLSQNNLSTAVTTLGYQYNLNEQRGLWNFSFDYYGWYPVVGINVSTGNRVNAAIVNNTILPLHWNETQITAEIKVPLNLTHGKWIRGIQPYFGYNILFRKVLSPDTLSFSNPNISTLSYQLYWYNQSIKSTRDIYPQWGQNIWINFQHTPFEPFLATQFEIQSRLYFPGILIHHSLFFYGGFESQSKDYFFQNHISIPRGYNNLYFIRYFTFQSNYTFPVAYPDLNLPEVFYLKRLYANVFYDYMKTYNLIERQFSSAGIELYSDWNFVSLFPNLSLGVRWNYRLTEKSSTFDYLFQISF